MFSALTTHLGFSEFDERDFVSGVQLLSDNYGAILSGNAALNGVTVTNVCRYSDTRVVCSHSGFVQGVSGAGSLFAAAPPVSGAGKGSNRGGARKVAASAANARLGGQ